jgi:secreted trypsin-like serine protease
MNSCGCSKRPATMAIIFGGESAQLNTWSWVVSLRNSSRHFCAGSILNEWYIITAAHCLEKTTSGLSSIIVCAGTNLLSDACQQRRSVHHVINHSTYNNRTLVNDIALIRVSIPFDFSDTSVTRICLPSTSYHKEYPQAGTDVIAVG